MRKLRALLGAMVVGMSCVWAQPAERTANKEAVMASVENHRSNLISISDQIWAAAETAFVEGESAKLLANYAEEQGFRVTRGVAEMPTAFVAEYGSGSPIIGILGEFDALPGISQRAQPTKQPLEEGAAGHGCGHNLFGTGSLGAAIAVKELMDAGKIKGTIRFYGTPAEEKYFGKLWMARAGLFDDLDVCLDWHPGDDIAAHVQSSQALVDFIIEFKGQAAHAAADPWNGRSASDALELYTTGLNYLREHVKPSVRIHYHIQAAGDVVNVVPDYSRIWTRIRDSHMEGVEVVRARAEQIVEGAALMADVEYEIRLVSGIREVIPNRTGGAALQANLELLGPIEYTEEELAFGKKIQEATNKPQIGIDGEIYPLKPTSETPPGGSTDVGDVSWIVPEIRLSVTTAPSGTPWHSWAVVACGGMSIGHKGMVFASKALAMTMVDLYENPELVAQVKTEFQERRGEGEYVGVLPDGPPPLAQAEAEAGK
ncbi:MAG: amidohydrolase [Bacteroidota bacterium]